MRGNGRLFMTAVFKLVTKMMRPYDQDERQPDGSMHWDIIGPVPFHRKLKQLFFFYSGGLISICSYSFWRRSNYFLSS